MSQTQRAECRRNSWLVALAGGVLVACMLLLVAQYPVTKALIAGLIFCVALGIFLVWAFCSKVVAEVVEQPAPAARPAAPAPTQSSRPDEAVARHAAPEAGARVQRTAEPEPAPKKAAKPASKPASDSKKAPAGKPASASGLDAALAKSKDEPPAPAPEMLATPRGGKADDLKMIKGIGPKLESLLNEVGVWHFDQIASWKAKDIAFVDEKMVGFHGRITRDEWVKQAKVLATGGKTDFSERVNKGGVY